MCNGLYCIFYEDNIGMNGIKSVAHFNYLLLQKARL